MDRKFVGIGMLLLAIYLPMLPTGAQGNDFKILSDETEEMIAPKSPLEWKDMHCKAVELQNHGDFKRSCGVVLEGGFFSCFERCGESRITSVCKDSYCDEYFKYLEAERPNKAKDSTRSSTETSHHQQTEVDAGCDDNNHLKFGNGVLCGVIGAMVIPLLVACLGFDKDTAKQRWNKLTQKFCSMLRKSRVTEVPRADNSADEPEPESDNEDAGDQLLGA